MDLISWAGCQTQTPMSEMTDKIRFSLCKTQTFNHTCCNSQLKPIFFFSPSFLFILLWGLSFTFITELNSVFDVVIPNQQIFGRGEISVDLSSFLILPLISFIKDKQKWYPPTKYQNEMWGFVLYDYIRRGFRQL